ncbi:MAG: ABC transporter permease [Bacteroidetes bacterium]|nr:ABC transporter permease [Bacteroidota bacterium]MBU1718842.1 ABC transporter permease [Bacteroidota bacterium]
MRTIGFFIQKEFLQIFRNRSMLPMIFMVPIIQLLVLTYAVTYEMKGIRIHISDADFSSTSGQLTGKFTGSPFFVVTSTGTTHEEAEQALHLGKADMALNIPEGFERGIMRSESPQVELLYNAVNANVAGLSSAYTSSLIADFQGNMIADLMGGMQGSIIPVADITYSYWYNQEMDYKLFMAPGILVMLVTSIGLFLTGMNIVREKEMGTIEQINVTPVKKYQFIVGKLSPFLIIGLGELAFGMLIARLMFGVPFMGSIWLIFLFAALYMLVLLGMGLIISTLTNTQQQAMLLSWFFLVIFIMMSGLFTPVESMPDWAQWIDRFNPLTYFIRVIRLVMLKGSGWDEVKDQFYIIGAYGVVMISVAVMRYRKVG